MTKRSVAWLLLLASAVLEAVWATALGLSDGLTVPLPTAVFAVTTTLSMIGLGLAIRSIPLGTAYAVWTGIGAAGTVLLGIVLFQEPATALRLAPDAIFLPPRHGKSELVTNLEDLEQALFLEQKLERHLKIEDQRVPGEVPA